MTAKWCQISSWQWCADVGKLTLLVSSDQAGPNSYRWAVGWDPGRCVGVMASGERGALEDAQSSAEIAALGIATGILNEIGVR